MTAIGRFDLPNGRIRWRRLDGPWLKGGAIVAQGLRTHHGPNRATGPRRLPEMQPGQADRLA